MDRPLLLIPFSKFFHYHFVGSAYKRALLLLGKCILLELLVILVNICHPLVDNTEHALILLLFVFVFRYLCVDEGRPGAGPTVHPADGDQHPPEHRLCQRGVELQHPARPPLHRLQHALSAT